MDKSLLPSHFYLYASFRVCDYIKYGWDVLLIDPDGGANIQRKLQSTSAHADTAVLQSIPKSNDVHWSKQIYCIPKITFGTIFDFLVDCKVLARKANYIDDATEKRDSSLLHRQDENKLSSADAAGDPIVYTRTLDKAYRFFQDGHVQKVRYHPMSEQHLYWCISFAFNEKRQDVQCVYCFVKLF